jgi:hypothetical protein
MKTAVNITATNTASIVWVCPATQTPMVMPPPIATGKDTAVPIFVLARLASPRAIEPIRAVMMPSSITTTLPCGPRSVAWPYRYSRPGVVLIATAADGAERSR